ncbi:hypothetical protein J2766_001164 [Agrobacterium tumefaciens]|uniref:Uncharacterized protein n=1 Tax=Agrobacterium tumefaciens TaxID=358 RepID=A0AAW8LPP5_AGRTU|nr:hypothetical protein [Agrobacterium tumefaciens]MBP2564605.1 hypothetical protein [Agrobacterium tumefaciens]MDR6701530.1 hypothetical protein [Agrobacterium tumefaciens]
MTEIVKIPPRPKYHDAVVVERAVERLVKPVQEWIDLRAQFQPKDLKSQLTDCIHNNGYEYAKELEERYGWEPDSALVECLDTLDIQSAHQNVVRAWVTLYNVKIPFNIGDRVCTPTIRAGTVKDFDRSTAQLAVQSDENRDEGKDYRTLIDFEDAIPILGTIGEAAPAEGGAA